jgi:cysteinyl-tRNA synthetase
MTNFEQEVSNDLGTPKALTYLEEVLFDKTLGVDARLRVANSLDRVLGFGLLDLKREDLSIRPKSAMITEDEIETDLDRRQEARSAKDFATSDAIRDALATKGVEVMDGDPLRWEWKLDIG